MITGLYMRVSTMEQANEGFSLPNQKRKLLAYCEAMNWSVGNIYCDEGISGYSIDKRPAVKQMLNDVKLGKLQNILILKVDRLCRNTKELLEIVDILNKYNVRLNAVDEQIDYTTDVGKMVLTLLGSFAEFERTRIANRMLDGKLQKINQGIKSLGCQAPYGYEYINNKFVIKPSEARVVKYIYDCVLNHKGYNSIAKSVAENLEFNFDHKTWSAQKIRRIIANPTYKGYCSNKDFSSSSNVVYKKASNIEPIISEELWDTVNALVKARYKNNNTQLCRDDYVFYDVAYCGNCGKRLNARTVIDGKYKRFYYTCRFKTRYFAYDEDKKPKCHVSFISGNKIERYFLQYFDNLEIPLIKQDTNQIALSDDDLKQDLLKQVHALQNKRKSLSNKFIDDLITPEVYAELNAEINNELDLLQKQIQTLDNNKKSAIIENIDYDTLLNIKITLKEVWNVMSSSEKRNFIALHFDKICFTKEGITKIVFKEAK